MMRRLPRHDGVVGGFLLGFLVEFVARVVMG